MRGQINQLDYFITSATGALNIQLPVYLLQRPTDRQNAIGSASIGTLMFRVLASPASDAHLAEQFTASLTLIGIFCNV